MGKGWTLLDQLNLGSLHTLLAFFGDEAHLLAFCQTSETVRFDRFEVNEQILTIARSRNEPIAFLIVEPLHGSFFSIAHVAHLCRLKIG